MERLGCMHSKDIADTGITLLKKGKQGLVHALFGRVGLLILSMILQGVLLFGAFYWFEDNIPVYLGGSVLFTIGILLYLINSKMDASAKITWLIIIMVLPVFGCLFYLWTQSEWGHKTLKALVERSNQHSRDLIKQNDSLMEQLAQEDPGAAGLAKYIASCGSFPIYQNTAVTYFPLGEHKWEAMLEQIAQAKHFIYLEYFIVNEGLMWGKVLEVLAKKAREGVDVRLMYDGTCELTTLPFDYPAKIQALGIQCKMFSPIAPIISTHYNYRDHRKILVIDGHTAFTGGVNLADEYINHIDRFGHWKDTAIMLRGEAAESFTLMFLQMWNIDEKTPVFPEVIPKISASSPGSGYVIPYSDCPLDDKKLGEMVYIDLLNRATSYVHIMTPYLILDGEMETALKFAAQRGVDVEIILPGIPDKQIPFALAKTHYKSLLSAGVKIYEYTPGFVHGKVFVCDDTEAVVGTINLDYRSLYHHFECAAYLWKTDCIGDIERDFQITRNKCTPVTQKTIKEEKLSVKLTGYLAKVIAPLL